MDIYRRLLRPDDGHGHEDEYRQEGENDGDRIRTGEVERVVALLHAERRGLGLPLDTAGDDRDRAVLAEAARRREDDAVDHRPADRRKGDPPERLPAVGAERLGGLLLLVADLLERGDDLPRDERERDEDRRDDHRGQREEELDAVIVEPPAEPALAP